MRRVTSNELLDEDLGTPAEVARSLDDLWRMNRWLGGVSSSLRMIGDILRNTRASSLRILDVGAGDGRLAARLRDELRERGNQVEFFILDRRQAHLQNGDPVREGLRPVVADALRLPFAEGSFDVVMCNLFFHHFSHEKATGVLRALARIASRAVLVNDLERHWVPYLFIRSAIMFTHSRLTRHDGPASVRQAYTREEVAGLAAAAGFTSFEVRRLAPFRLGLTLRKNGQASSKASAINTAVG
jgi:ubiquinone/menaquinone biosynthesis C-methylase UbiE